MVTFLHHYRTVSEPGNRPDTIFRPYSDFPLYACVSVGIALGKLTTCIDSCNQQHNQDTEQSHYYNDPRAASLQLIRPSPSPFPHPRHQPKFLTTINMFSISITFLSVLLLAEQSSQISARHSKPSWCGLDLPFQHILYLHSHELTIPAGEDNTLPRNMLHIFLPLYLCLCCSYV